jgi:hypothetical protein
MHLGIPGKLGDVAEKHAARVKRRQTLVAAPPGFERGCGLTHSAAWNDMYPEKVSNRAVL